MSLVANNPHRLCPHVKTHKSEDVLRLYLDCGVTQFKCATLAELEMVARCNADFGLLAMQPTGPNPARLVELARSYPQTSIATVVDNPLTLDAIERAAATQDVDITVLVDIDNGMGRTGIKCGDECFELYERLSGSDSVRVGGLHVYDGHIHDHDLSERRESVEQAMAEVLAFRTRLLDAGFSVPQLITGGTPSFPIHAAYEDRICSPGTPVFWDAGYMKSFPDLEFLPAAVLLTRVISKLSGNRVCTDLGYKEVAAEMPKPRVQFLNVDVIQECSHSEEHLVIELPPDSEVAVGDILYAVPTHICPTVARHDSLLVVEDGAVVDTWSVTARNRKITI